MFNTLTRMGAAGAGTDDAKRSLRFNSGDTAYLDRTPSGAGNSKTWTVSFWMKLAKLGVQHFPFSTGANGSNRVQFAIENSHYINLECTDGGSNQLVLVKDDRLFRDITSWYHFVISVDTTQATSSNRGKIYVNGEQLTGFSTETYPNQNDDLQWNKAAAHYVGKRSYSSNYTDGYIAEFYSVDGTALAPTSFGETDTDTGEWIPKEYTGSYGTNGFYLDFSDNSDTTSSTLGKDSAGSNDWTPNNFVTGDSVIDSPTNNFATLNSLVLSPQITFTEGSLHAEIGNSHKTVYSTIAVKGGKWYWEGIAKGSGSKYTIGVSDVRNVMGKQESGTNYLVGNTSNSYAIGDAIGLYKDDLNKNGSAVSSNILSDTISDGEICGVALDLDNNKVWFSHKGVWVNGSGTSSTTLDSGNHDTTVAADQTYCAAFSGEDSDWQANFGQDSSFSGTVTAQGNKDSAGKGNFYYSVPSGFKALCTANLPDVTIKKGSDYFSNLLYNGQSSTPLTRTGVGFEPDMTWLKVRSSGWGTGAFTKLHGTGVGSGYKYNFTNTDAGEDDEWGTLTFGADGWSGVSSDYNGSFAHDFGANGNTFVSWNWKESASAGFDMVSYTGDGTTDRELAHGLGVAPDFYLIKSKSEAHDWNCWHSSLASGQYGALNSGDAFASDSGGFMHGAPTSSVLKLGTWNAVNKDTVTYIAYCFASVEGYCKTGKYVGNNSTDGPYIHLGFRPAFLMVKNASTDAEEWEVFDSGRDPYNVGTKRLKVSKPDTEVTSTFWDFVSTGVKARNTSGGYNNNGDTFIYIAFAESPFKYANAL